MNKQLCELLGIKPKYKVTFYTLLDVFETEQEALDYMELEGFKIKPIEEVYPDFTNPINFVKLLGLLRDCNFNIWFGGGNGKLCLQVSYGNHHYGYGYHIRDIQVALSASFVEMVKNTHGHFRNESSEILFQKAFGNLKQQAQQINWKY